MQLLETEPGLTLTELARRAEVSRQSMWEIVQTLENAGLTTRLDSGRARSAVLNNTGKRYLNQARREIAETENLMLANITVSERKTLKSLLAKLVSPEDARGDQ